MSDYDVVVIGAGVGGLGAAAMLAKDFAKKVLVLERAPFIGGRAVSFTGRGNKVVADGVEFDSATVTTVRSGGVPWLAGANRSLTLADFPSTGRSVTLQWVESYQNFVITAVTGE